MGGGSNFLPPNDLIANMVIQRHVYTHSHGYSITKISQTGKTENKQVT